MNSSSIGLAPPDAPLSFAAARSVKRELLEELHQSYQQGHPTPPEDLLARWPTDPRQDEDVANLLFDDFCQRLRQGEDASIADYDARFPEHQESLARLAQQQEFLASLGHGSGSSNTRLRLPAVQDEIFGFHLKHELGHGAFARVFLAEQIGLAGRPVVLKVSGILGHEPQTLALLQHTNIVPIYSLHDDERAGLRAVCMPYFGGATLAQLMRTLWADGQPPTHGEELTNSLESFAPRALGAACQSGEGVTNEERGTRNEESGSGKELPHSSSLVPRSSLMNVRSPLASLSYVQAAAWITARLAEGLQHAHERGIYHRDIKPSNILLSADGQPMLLDFNLAHNIHDTQAQATLGGTVAYMAPEHLRALAASDPGLSRQVDQRSDIYSLGLVLCEMLLGKSPFEQNASYAPLRDLIVLMAAERSQGVRIRKLVAAGIPRSLESIVRKCLEPNPKERYQKAEELAEDLRRFLDDRPLLHAPELSWTERIGKWLRRHPRLTASGSVATAAFVLLAAIGLTLYGVHEGLQAAQARERQQQFDAGAIQTLGLLNLASDVQDQLPAGMAECEKTLRLYQVLDRPDWQQLASWQRLSADERVRIGQDVRELLLLLAWAREKTGAESQVLLDRAEAIADLPSASAYGHYRHALQLIVDKEKGRTGLLQAVQELTEALRLNPRHYAALTQRGICHYELGDYALACADFGQCIGLRPEVPWGYFNRGRTLDKHGKKAEAILDYTTALHHDGNFVLAHGNRGLARVDLKQYALALDDFEAAAKLGQDNVSLHAGRGLALSGLQRFAEADAAFAAAFARTSAARPEMRAWLALSYGFAVAPRLPSKAAEAFAEVLKAQPKHPQAHYGQALLLVAEAQPGSAPAQSPAALKKLEQALQSFHNAIEANPQFTDARRFRAIVAARLGQWKQAYQDIDWCLATEPRSGATLYAAACVAALTAQAAPPQDAPRAAERALNYLQEAFAEGYGRDRAATDPDLSFLRTHAEFQRLLAKG